MKSSLTNIRKMKSYSLLKLIKFWLPKITILKQF